jgi:Tfp pilus assembly protein PilO
VKDPKKVERLGRVALGTLLAAFLTAAWLQGVRPLMAAQRNLSSFRKAVQILTEAQGSAERLDAQVRRLNEEVARTEALLPRALNLDEFLEQVDGLAKRSGVRLISLTPDGTAEQELYREMFLEAQIQGPYAAVYGFLVTLEQGSRLLSLTDLQMSREPERGSCVARLRIALYFAREVNG